MNVDPKIIVTYLAHNTFTGHIPYSDGKATGKWKIITINDDSTLSIEITHTTIDYINSEERHFDWLPWFTKTISTLKKRTLKAWVPENNIIITVKHPEQDCSHE